MEKINNTLYIIRFTEKNEIITLKISDTRTMIYIIDKLEDKAISYVLIKQEKDCYKHTIDALLDYKEE